MGMGMGFGQRMEMRPSPSLIAFTQMLFERIPELLG